MQEFILTVVAIYVLFRIFGSARSHTYTFNQHNYHKQEEQRRDGKIKIDHVPEKKATKGDKDKDGGEYVDYEEIK